VPFAACPYLGFSVLLLVLTGFGALLWVGQPARRTVWRLMLIGGLCCGPFGLFSFMYIPKYWNPVLTCWFGPASPEDILFAVATGAITMCCALWPFARGLHLPGSDWRLFGARALRFCALGIGSGYALIYALWFGAHYRIDTMLACLISIALSAALVFRERPDLFRLCLPGVLFMPYYWLAMRLSFLIWPQFLHSWDAPEQNLGWIGGVPLYELLWALGLGTVWPVFIAWCSGLRLERPAAEGDAS
jgi:hypothetical protein